MCERVVWAERDSQRLRQQVLMLADPSWMRLRNLIRPIHKPGWLPAEVLAAVRLKRKASDVH